MLTESVWQLFWKSWNVLGELQFLLLQLYGFYSQLKLNTSWCRTSCVCEMSLCEQSYKKG